MQTPYRFSGHETFICKQFWPKKGIDFLSEGRNFTDIDAVVKLGVGKNMVSSIRFWLKAIGLTNNNDDILEHSQLIFGSEGLDPYVEDAGTLWLLHYYLVSKNYASIYNIIFNQFLIGKTEFNKSSLHNYIERYLSSVSSNAYNEKTINNDINVFIKNYIITNPTRNSASIEEDFFGLFCELNILNHYKRKNTDDKIEDYFQIERKERGSLPEEIFLYSILLNDKLGNVISFSELVTGHNSPGNIFLLNKDGIFQQIERLSKKYSFISFSRSAGNIVIQIDKNPSPTEILRAYYEN